MIRLFKHYVILCFGILLAVVAAIYFYNGDISIPFVMRNKTRSTVEKLVDKFETGRRYVIHGFGSRLGNHMFQYAFLRSTAEKFNATAILSVNSMLLTAFNLDAQIMNNDIFDKFIDEYENITRIPEKCCAYDPKVFEGMFRDRQFEVTRGAMESLRYFQEQEALIRKEFTFLPHILEAARKRFEVARQAIKSTFFKDIQKATYVGVHIRHGDVATDDVVIESGLIAASKEYIYHGLEHFRTKYDNVFFVVATDNATWTGEVLKSSQKGDIYLLPPDSPEIDMATLTLCNHTLATTGTYSWWTGYLTNGETVFYKNWPRNGSTAYDDFGREDYFPKNWIFFE